MVFVEGTPLLLVLQEHPQTKKRQTKHQIGNPQVSHDQNLVLVGTQNSMVGTAWARARYLCGQARVVSRASDNLPGLLTEMKDRVLPKLYFDVHLADHPTWQYESTVTCREVTFLSKHWA